MKYQGISLEKELLDSVKDHVEIDRRYKNVTEFIRHAIVEKLDKQKEFSEKLIRIGIPEDEIGEIMYCMLADGKKVMKK